MQPSDNQTGTISASILWHRLDAPGYDACRLVEQPDSRRLEGTAVFLDEHGPACLAYVVECDREWRTHGGAVHGWVGARAVDLRVARQAGDGWTVNGSPIAGLDACVDLDFGFTPATNLLQLRRIALRVGETADAPVAWPEATSTTLDRLEQRYERRAEGLYAYEAPRFDYSAVLEVSAAGS